MSATMGSPPESTLGAKSSGVNPSTASLDLLPRQRMAMEGNKMAKEKRKESVAIVGSGMAGLVTAHLLVCDKQERFDVEVLEVQERLSLDSASYTLPSASKAKAKSTSKPDYAGSDSGYSTGVESAALSTTEQDKVRHAACEDADEDEDADEGQRIDLPMRAFAAGYYDNLRRMYEYLGVKFAEPKFVYSISTLPSAPATATESAAKGEGNDEYLSPKQNSDGTYFIHSSNNHIIPPIRPGGVAWVSWVVEIAYLLFWYSWFTAACFWVAPKTRLNLDLDLDLNFGSKLGGTGKLHGTGESLRSYLSRIGIPSYYTWNYFLPLMSSITTCTHHQLLDFPASDIIGYARQTYRKPHYTVTGGVQKAEDRLSSGLSVKFNTRVTNVESLKGGRVRVSWISQDDKQEEGLKEYDRVIIAVTPDVVGRIFAPLRHKMAAIPTTSVQTVVHRDFSRVEACSAYLRDSARLQRKGFKALDLDMASTSTSPSTGSAAAPLTAMHMVTNPSTVQTESIHEHPANMLVTTYALENSIDESKILHRVRFTRVLRTSRSRDVVNSIFATADPNPAGNGNGHTGWKSGDGNVFIVGGWCWDGMVLLEGCIVSAMRVADALGVDVPWGGDDGTN
ncbi:hypothetical protein BDW62DRAFT_198177 [Aspergillus aurantiobrunneus]